MRHSLHGFSLIETLVVIGIFAAVSVALNGMISYVLRTNAETLKTIAVSGSELHVGEALLRTGRSATYGVHGEYPVEDASASHVTFYSAGIEGMNPVRSTYALTGGVLTETDATPVEGSTEYGNAHTKVLLREIKNDDEHPLFRFYDSAGNELIEVSNPHTIASFSVSVGTNGSGGEVRYRDAGTVTLRNITASD